MIIELRWWRNPGRQINKFAADGVLATDTDTATPSRPSHAHLRLPLQSRPALVASFLYSTPRVLSAKAGGPWTKRMSSPSCRSPAASGLSDAASADPPASRTRF